MGMLTSGLGALAAEEAEGQVEAGAPCPRRRQQPWRGGEGGTMGELGFR